MKSFFLILTTSYLFSISILAQSYDALIGKANQFYLNKDYQNSGEQFDAAFQIREGKKSDYYNAACSWAQAGASQKAIAYLENAIKGGYLDINWMKKDKDLRSLKKEESWVKLMENFQKVVDDYEKDFDKLLKKQLDEIFMKDQFLRKMLDYVIEDFGSDSDEFKYLIKLMNEQDSLNEAQLITIIKEKGWPKISEVGNTANMTAFLVIQHAPLETQEKYLPFLKSSVKEGESFGGHLAYLEDRILISKGKKQLYGTQLNYDPKTDTQSVAPIENPININKRRASVGLGTIEAYLAKLGVEWQVKK